MSTLRILKEKDITAETVCLFCRKSTVDEMTLGEFYTRDGITAHYYCVLLSAGLMQRGDDTEGILGFLPGDIRKEIQRSRRLKCKYCGLKGASIGCSVIKCRKSFHFPCGLKNGVNYQFLGNYESYCAEHGKKQIISVESKDWECLVCLSAISPSETPLATICCKDAVFHRDCIQKLALSSGLLFKCPKCNDASTFVEEMKAMGVYVPERDASWERESGAFADLLVQNFKCDAADCQCPAGRNISNEEGDWALANCSTCAASGMHKKCGDIDDEDLSDWECQECAEIDQKLVKKRKAESAKKKKHLSHNGQRRRENGQRRSNRKRRDWKMSELRISPTCNHYFPYSKAKLKRFDNKRSLPDWRFFELRVNLGQLIKGDMKGNWENDHTDSSSDPSQSQSSSASELPSSLNSTIFGDSSRAAPRRALSGLNHVGTQGEKRKMESHSNSQEASGPINKRALRSDKGFFGKEDGIAMDTTDLLESSDKNGRNMNGDDPEKTLGISSQ